MMVWGGTAVLRYSDGIGLQKGGGQKKGRDEKRQEIQGGGMKG